MPHKATSTDSASDKPKLFVSYSRRDTEFTVRLVSALGIRDVEAILDTQAIADAEVWKARLEALIVDADAVAFVMSPDSIASEHCEWEVERTLELQKRVIPVLYRKVEDTDVPEKLSRFQRIPALPEETSSWGDVAQFDSFVDRIAAAARTDIAWVREHTRLVALAARWREEQSPIGQLLRQDEIVSAQSWATRRPPDAPAIPDLLSDYLDESRQFEDAGRARDRRRSRWLLGLAAMVIIVIGAAALGFLQTTREANRDLSLVLAATANDAISAGEVDRGARLAALAAHESITSPAADEAQPTLARAAHSLRLVSELRGHSSSVEEAILSPDGRVAITMGDKGDPTARVWDVDTGTEIGRLGDEEVRTTSVAYAAGLPLIATGSEKGEIRIFRSSPADFRMWELVHEEALGGCNVVRLLVFESGGDRLVASCANGVAYIMVNEHAGPDPWHPAHTFEMHTKGILDAAFSPDGNSVATVGRDAEAFVWDARSYVSRESLQWDQGNIFRVRFSKGGRRLLTAGDSATGHLWELTDEGSWKHLTNLGGHEDWIVDAALFRASDESPSYFLTASWDGSLIFWDTQTGARKESINAAIGKLHRVSVADTAAVILLAGADGVAKVLQSVPDSLGRWHKVALRGHAMSVRNASFSGDGSRVITASLDGTARVWDTLDMLGTPSAQIAVSEAPARIVRLATIGTTDSRTWTIIAIGSDGNARVWMPEDHRAGALERPPVIAPWGDVESAAVSLDGRTIAMANFDGHVRIWGRGSNARQGWSEIFRFEDSSKFVRDIALSASGARIVIAGDDLTARVHERADSDARLWDRVHTLAGHGSAVTAVALTPSGDHVVTATDAGKLYVWSQGSGPEAVWAIGTSLTPHEKTIRHVTVSRDGQSVVTASDDGYARVFSWRSEDDSELTDVSKLYHPDVQVLDATFSPDGARVVTAGSDGFIRVWDARTGIEMATFSGHAGVVSSVTVSPDGRRVVSGGDDSRVHVWDGSWLVRRPSNQALVEEVCTRRLLGNDVVAGPDRDPASPTVGSIRRISQQDVESVPILRARQGEDVCANPSAFGLTEDWTYSAGSYIMSRLESMRGALRSAVK